MSVKIPSSGAAHHLLPPGEKEEERIPAPPATLPSPLVGEGARRAGEGAIQKRSARLKVFSRSMRHSPTEAERLLWRRLRARRFADHKFRRQVPLGPYIADFVCFKAKLVVELDGGQHGDNPHDKVRDGWLCEHGFSILRIWNNDLMQRQDSALDAIWNAVSNPEDNK